MNRVLTFLLLLSSVSLSALGMERAQGDCMKGGARVVSNGVNSTTRVMQSYVNLSGTTPISGCTVSVFVVGTADLASIFSDNSGTAKANPFVADATGHWFFYGAGRFDVTMSAAGIPTPFTLGDIKLLDEVSVTDYGAKCDGSTDDTEAIQDAINATSAANVELRLPGGDPCMITAVGIPSNFHLIGQGMGVSILKQVQMSAAAGTPMLTNSSHGGGNLNITLEKFTLDGNQSNQSVATSSGFGTDVNGISFLNVGNVLISRVAFVNILAKPVFGYEWSNLTIRDSKFTAYGFNTANTPNSGCIELTYTGSTGPSSNINLIDNFCDGSGAHVGGIKLAGTSDNPFSYVNVQGNSIVTGAIDNTLGIELYNNGPTASDGFFSFRVVNNFVRGENFAAIQYNTWGISIAGAGGNHGVVANNTVQWAGSYGIEAAGVNNTVISGNQVNDGAGIQILATAPSISGDLSLIGVVVENNVVYNPRSQGDAINPTAGIILYGESGHTSEGTIIQGNTIVLTGAYAVTARAIWLQCNGGSGEFSDTIIANNTLRGPSDYVALVLEEDATCPISNTLVTGNHFNGWDNGINVGTASDTRVINNAYVDVPTYYVGTPPRTTIILDPVPTSDSDLAWPTLTPTTSIIMTKPGQYIQTKNTATTPNVITWNTTNGGDCSIGGVLSTNSRQNTDLDPVANGWTKTSSGAYARAAYYVMGACRYGVGFGDATDTGPNPPIDNYVFIVEDSSANTSAVTIGGIGVGRGVSGNMRVQDILISKGTWNPGTVSAGGTAATALGLSGCVAGDITGAALTTITGASNLIVSSYAATNNVNVIVYNPTGGGITPGSGTLGVWCIHTN